MGGPKRYRTRRWPTAFSLAICFILLWLSSVTAPAAPPADGDLYFTIWRNERNVGFDYLRFRNEGDQLRVERFIRIDIRLLMVPIYTYRYQCMARWEGDTLQSLTAHTNDNGTITAVSAERTDGQLRVQTNGESRIVRGDLIPTNWWNPEFLHRDQLLNTQTGDVEQIRVEPGPTETIEASGRTVQARRYEIRGDLTLTIWFDSRDQWVRLTFERSGSTFTYRREEGSPPADFEKIFTHPSRPTRNPQEEST